METTDDVAAPPPNRKSSTRWGGASRFAQFLRPPSNEHHERRDAVLLGTLLGTFALGSLAIYLPLWGCLALLAGLAISWYAAGRFGRYQTITTAVSLLLLLYISLIQPMIGLFIGPVLLSGACQWICVRRFRLAKRGRADRQAKPSRSFGDTLASTASSSSPDTLASAASSSRREPASTPVKGKGVFSTILRFLFLWLVRFVLLIAGVVPFFFLYDWVYKTVIPAVHPFTVSAWNMSPALYVIGASLVTLYCIKRLKTSNSLVYKMAPGFSVVIFAVLYPMHESLPGGVIDQFSVGDGAEWLFAMFVFIFGVFSPALLRLTGMATGLAFLLLFGLFQYSDWAYMSVIAYSMPVRMITTAPTTTFGRLMPLEVGNASCPQGNTTPKTTTGPVSIALNGKHFDYQCALHYTQWVGIDPILSLVQGATLSVIRVDAGTKSGEVREVQGRFFFGEDSPYFRASVMARHPGAKIGDFNYTEAGGALELGVSYTQKRLSWGAMIPAVGGSVFDSQNGSLQDYTVAEAAAESPEFFQVPEGIVLLRAKAFAGYRSPFASAWKPDEVSDTDTGPAGPNQSAAGNRPPFALGLSTGPAWFVGLEPQGTTGTAMNYFMFFDARYGVADILDVSGVAPKLKGLRDIQHLAPSVVAGNNGLYGLAPIPLLPGDGRCFYSTSIMGPHADMRNLDFQGVAIFTCNGDKVSTTVLDSSEAVEKAIAGVKAVRFDTTAVPPAPSP
jgi:hypothetical protein